jgi:hypothetical protein
VDLIGPYTLKGKDKTEIDFMCLTMIDPHCKRIVSKTQVSVSYAVSNFFSLTELLTESESCLSWKEWGVFSQFLLTVSKI